MIFATLRDRVHKWPKLVKVLVVLSLLVMLGIGGYLRLWSSQVTTSYQTAVVSKGSLVSSITATGSISSGNTTNIATKASGTINKVYVKNGDAVTKGQKLLEITLDSDGVERRSNAWKAYLLAQQAVAKAEVDKTDAEITVWQDKQAILDAEEFVSHVENYANLTDAEKHEKETAVTQAKLTFDEDALKLSQAKAMIEAAKIEAQASYLDYQDVSGIIVAPATGIVNNLTLTEGSTLTASSSQSTSTGSTYASSQNIGFIRAANNEYLAVVSLTEVDVVKVVAGQKVTMTLDAHPDKTFTGKVLAVDITGASSSGVSNYPATIVMDATELPIYPNMSVSATIITNTVTDALIVPSAAITTSNGESTIKIMKNNLPETVTVEVGASNDTQTVIVSGINEGDTIITGSSTSEKNSNTSSAFSSNSQSSGNRSGSNIRIPVGGPGF